MPSLRTLTILSLLLAPLYSLFHYLDSNLDNFYIFNPTHLHDLSLRAISAHGNDTRSVVSYIVSELSESSASTSSHVNLDEEWIFNNAGGAMGAMYIIHASMAPLPDLISTQTSLAHVRRYNRIPDHLRDRNRHRRPHRPTHRRRLFPHHTRHAARIHAWRV